jgi:hypothetical protein
MMVDFKRSLEKVPKEYWNRLCTPVEFAVLLRCTRTTASNIMKGVPPEKVVRREFKNGIGRVSQRNVKVYSIRYLLRWWKEHPEHYRTTRPTLPKYLCQIKNLWKINNANRIKQGRRPLQIPGRLKLWILEHYTNGLHARTASMVEALIRDGHITKEEIEKYIPNVDL